MIFEHFHIDAVTVNEIEELVIRSENGATMLSLIEAAERFQLSAVGLRVLWEGLSSLNLPVIAFIRCNHFVIIDQVSERHIIIRDPAVGMLSMKRKHFLKIWRGEVLVFE